MSTQPTDHAAVDAARLVLARMGVDPQDLLNTSPTDSAQKAAPTLQTWVTVVAGLVSPGTARSYSTYWNKAITEWPDRRLGLPRLRLTPDV